MKESVADLVLGISTVVYVSAVAIRGLLNHDALLAIVGLTMLVVIATTESAITLGWLKVPSAGEGMPWMLCGRRAARVTCVGIAALSVYHAARCIVGATRHDWGACLFYAITTAAGVGILIGFASLSRRWVERSEDGVGRSSNTRQTP